jgi:hypothetical protein
MDPRCCMRPQHSSPGLVCGAGVGNALCLCGQPDALCCMDCQPLSLEVAGSAAAGQVARGLPEPSRGPLLWHLASDTGYLHITLSPSSPLLCCKH